MQTFSRKRRLIKKSDYDNVFQGANKVATAHFILFFRRNTLGYSRLGLALSRKKIAKAHDRNRIKRLLRESFRYDVLPSVDIVVLAKQDASKVNHKVLLGQLSLAWEKIRQYSEK